VHAGRRDTGSAENRRRGCAIPRHVNLVAKMLAAKMMERPHMNTVQEIEHAIQALTPPELEELYSWLDQNCPQPIDARLQSDLAAGRLDKEKNGRVQPL
jgi:hypothetical protein